MNKLISAIIAAIVTALMTWFCAAAGGCQWGTDGAGLIAAVGCAISIASFIAVITFPGNLKP